MYKFLSVGLVWVALFVLGSFAQDASSAAQMSFSDLIAQAEYASGNDEPVAAIPVLKEIISRTGELEDKGARESVQTARLQLGAAYSKLQKWADARTYTQEYLAGEPVKDRTAALQILCQIDLAEKNWGELQKNATEMLAGNIGSKDQMTAELFQLQAAFHLEQYAQAMELLLRVIPREKDPDTLRAYRIMQLRCLFETGKTAEMITSLPVLFRGETREDPVLNLTLLRIGDQLFDRQQYRKALVMYRLVMPKAELLTRNQERLANAEAQGGGKAWKFESLKQALETLRGVPDYDIYISYRAAQIYSEQKRFWEAVVLFDQIYSKHAEKEEGKAACFQKVLILFVMEENEEAIAEATDFLEKNRTGLYPRMMCGRLAQYYLDRQKLVEALALDRYADGWTKPANQDELEQETTLRYMFGFALFQLGEYTKAFAAFDRVIQLSPDSQAAIDSNYWKAMCQLLQQKYELAYDQFINYRKTWPRASFAPAALFRAGVCRFGLKDYEGAKKTFKTFIDDYPEDALMPEALAMFGDLLAADGLIDEALANYDRAFGIVEKNYARATDELLKTQMVAPATYAVLQAAQALKADAEAYLDQQDKEMAEVKYKRIILWMERYMKSFGENADWAQGVFWIGKAQIELGDPDKAVKAYLDTVIKQGTDPAQEGVAAILFDLAGIIKQRLNETQREQTLVDIQYARNRAESRTLQIRLDVLLAELDGTRDELGRTLLVREKKLDEVPPSGLALMCSALLDKKDYSRSQEFFDLFAQKYENSLFREPSFQLRAEDLYLQKKNDEAFDLAVETLSMYGATTETGWAQLMKGNVELARGEYKKAVETFNAISSVRAWRGPVSAEAMYRMADAWYQEGNYEKAFAFFQRTYLLYKAYDGGRWAADGYLRSAECLRKMGRVTAARNTYRAMLLDEYVRDLPQAQKAKEILGPVETAELLSGSTNLMETVELEVSP